MSRFASTTEEEMGEILKDKNAKNTNRATESALNTLSDYLKEKGHPLIQQNATENLPKLLTKFYTDLYKVDGEIYKLSSLKCIQTGLNRYFKSERKLNIIADPRFMERNEMLKGVAIKSKKLGKALVKSYPPIEPEDMIALGEYFDHDLMNAPDPCKLQECVLFYVLYFFCHRGRENLYIMDLDTFRLSCDPDGTRFVEQVKDEKDKNHSVDATTPTTEGRMYENPGLSNFFIQIIVQS